MLSGEQLHILRLKKNISLMDIARYIEVDALKLMAYECEDKPIPERIYAKWITILKPYGNSPKISHNS